MKNIILLLFIYTSFSSCCEKQGCIYTPLKTVLFKNFPTSALDSVWVYRLDAINNFTKPIDSLFVTVRKDEDSLFLLSSRELRITELNVYKIKVPKVSKEYLISDMRFKKTKDCNACYPVRPRAAYYQKFVGYKINGVSMDGNFIEISF